MRLARAIAANGALSRCPPPQMFDVGRLAQAVQAFDNDTGHRDVPALGNQREKTRQALGRWFARGVTK